MDAPATALDFAPSLPRRTPFVLRLLHLVRNGYPLNLAEPQRFNELVQARKLLDRDPALPRLADKVRVKEFVASRLGDEWVIPTRWHGKTLPEMPLWPKPFVLKSSHASCQCIFVRDRAANWTRIRDRAHAWLRKHYGGWMDEWLYGEIEPQLLVEPFVGSGDMLPTDYKFFVFGGRAEFIQVDTDREHGHKRAIFDRSWRRLPVELQFPQENRHIPPPVSLQRMIEAAEALSRGFDFVRVDLYETAGHPLFGEMTFYPGSGLDRFYPVSFDTLFGRYWLHARAHSPSW